MPTIECPRCGRELPASDEELENGQLFECAGCNTRFQAPPPDDSASMPQPVGMAKGTRLAIQVGFFVLVPALLLEMVWLAVSMSNRAAAIAAANPTAIRPRGHAGQVDEPTPQNAPAAGDLVVGLIVLPSMVGGIVSLVGLSRRCPSCRRWWAKQHVGRTIVESRKAYGIVRRHGESHTHGHYGGFGSHRTGSYTGSSSHRTYSSWEERVPVVRTTFLVNYQCRYCSFAWDKTEVEEHEDFER
jgi:hypothetical protein